MAFTITKLRNQISSEKDFSRKMELKASLKRTIDNFNKASNELIEADLEKRLKKLSAPTKKGGRGRVRKMRRSKTHRSKTHKNKK